MQKFVRWLIISVIGLAVIVFAISLSPLEYLIKGVRATYLNGEVSATIDDKQFFDTELIPAEKPKPWPAITEGDKFAPDDALWAQLNSTESVALAVFRNDRPLFNWFAEGYSDTSRTNSFSMAKTITALLAEMAIENGEISGWDQPVIELLPELKGEYVNQLTLYDLSIMQGGLEWEEHYTNAFSIMARAYYAEDIFRVIMDGAPISTEPGTKFEYQSGATQLLGMAVERATGRSLAELASAWIWTPAGAMDDAEWHLDGTGQVLCYCCFNSNAMDFARIGHILLNQGRWKQHHFIDSSAARDFFNPISTPYYGRSIWLGRADEVSYSYLHGINGQFVIIIPEYDAVIVRLGHQVGEMYNPEWYTPKTVDMLVRYYAEKFEENPIDIGW